MGARLGNAFLKLLDITKKIMTILSMYMQLYGLSDVCGLDCMFQNIHALKDNYQGHLCY